jgi:hypothetical protein
MGKHQQRARQRDYWVTVVSDPVPVAEVIVLGGGKDCDLMVALADGRSMEMGVAELVVSTDGQVKVELECVDDVDVQVRYSGDDLELRAVRLSGGDGCDEQEFRRDVRPWLASDLVEGLPCIACAEITLATAGG